MSHSLNWYTRKIHRWGALITLVPLALVIVSGILLQVKKQVPWVQPPTTKGSAPGRDPAISWTQILNALHTVPEAAVQHWEDVERLDVQPGKGVVKVQTKNRWEVQVDLNTGAVLSHAYRRSDLIESLHDGTFFGEWAKLGVFLPNGIILGVLWLTGIYLWYLPFRSRAKKQARLAQQSKQG